MIARAQASRLFGVAALASTLLVSGCAPQRRVTQPNPVVETVSPTDLRIGQSMTVRMCKGSIEAQVTKIDSEKR